LIAPFEPPFTDTLVTTVVPDTGALGWVIEKVLVVLQAFASVIVTV
jgi:hypothetical protein